MNGNRPAAAAARPAWVFGASARVEIPIVLGSVALAAAATRWLDGPAAAVVAAGAALGWGGARLARTCGASGLWLALVALSILGGEVSAVSLGGQSGRVLWADVVLAAGAAWAMLRGRLAFAVPPAPFIVAQAALTAWAGVSLLFARDPLSGIAELKEWLAAGVVAVAAARFAADARRARVLLAVVVVTGCLVAAAMTVAAFRSPYGPLLAILLKKVDLSWGRSNYLAGLLILALPVAVGLLGHAERWRFRLPWLAATAALGAGVAISASKGAVLALVSGLAAAIVTGGRAARLAAGVTVLVLGVGTALYALGPLQEVLRYRLQASALDYSIGERAGLYELAWDRFTRHPLTGVGLNNFSVAARRLRGVDTVPHNLELGFLAELGAPGLALALFWLGALGVAAWRARSPARPAPDRALGLGLWAAFVAFAAHNQLESTLYGEQYKILLMLVAAATWRLASEPVRGRAFRPGPAAAGLQDATDPDPLAPGTRRVEPTG